MAKKTARSGKIKAAPLPGAPLDGPADAEARILDAARSVFVRRGTAGARMQEIAAEAGVNQALLHYYFRSKDQLSAAVFEQMASRLFPVLLQTLAMDIPLDMKVARIVELYHENMARNPFLPGYILAELHHHPQRIQSLLAKVGGGDPASAFLPAFVRLGEQIEAEVRAGRMRPIGPRQFVVNLVSLCIFPFAARPMLSIMLGLDDETFPSFIDERRRTLADFYMNALRP
ncbi:MAG TPA: TetR family transcriptional regulator [Gemmatimonadaceae bacterium]|nr:TetR family transcriptional regulator [Gemmatimonadaceae bacterium]